MSRMRITIDQLVLKGFAPEQRQPMVEALQGELSRMLVDTAIRVRWVRLQHMRLGSIPLDPGCPGARKLGAGIARAIKEGLKR
jgi:hypothetical protein